MPVGKSTAILEIGGWSTAERRDEREANLLRVQLMHARLAGATYAIMETAKAELVPQTVREDIEQWKQDGVTEHHRRTPRIVLPELSEVVVVGETRHYPSPFDSLRRPFSSRAQCARDDILYIRELKEASELSEEPGPNDMWIPRKASAIGYDEVLRPGGFEAILANFAQYVGRLARVAEVVVGDEVPSVRVEWAKDLSYPR